MSDKKAETSPERRAVKAFSERAATLASAESCTGGLIGKRLTDVPGASAMYLGGVISYSNSVKTGLLNVSPDDLKRVGAVSHEVAAQMARGVRRATGADVAVSTTGIAGPGGGSDEKPAGLVYVGIDSENGTRTYRLELWKKIDMSLPNARSLVRNAVVGFALDIAVKEITSL